MIVYTIEDGKVVMTRAERGAADDPFATFSEWDGAIDRKAYGEL
ncbi:MAG: hypothetical protein NT113_04445 [Hyphomicrobiales bacterium]|nr:hypothetical protein [Hyphomicrobiales bacterium]